jgi:dihydrodipicolinate synthase/N-acetylneuraminate lyase
MATSNTPVSGICPVLETPFTEHGEVDYESFGRLIDHLVRAGIQSVMFPGFASEYHKLSDVERTNLTTVLLDRVSGLEGFTTVISIPDHATHLAVRRAVDAAEAGASAINVLPPHQLGPSGEAVREHVRAVARAVAPVPVILQYAPALTGTALDATAIAQMARDEPNLTQVKVEATPPGALITSLLAQRPAISSVVGYAGVQLIDALRRGAVGAQPGSSFVELYLEIWTAWQDGRHDAAAELHRRLLPYISYWMQSVELIIAAEKRISLRRGLIDSDYCRAPTRRLDAEEDAMIERFLDEFRTQLSGTGTREMRA